MLARLQVSTVTLPLLLLNELRICWDLRNVSERLGGIATSSGQLSSAVSEHSQPNCLGFRCTHAEICGTAHTFFMTVLPMCFWFGGDVHGRGYV